MNDHDKKHLDKLYHSLVARKWNPLPDAEPGKDALTVTLGYLECIVTCPEVADASPDLISYFARSFGSKSFTELFTLTYIEILRPTALGMSSFRPLPPADARRVSLVQDPPHIRILLPPAFVQQVENEISVRDRFDHAVRSVATKNPAPLPLDPDLEGFEAWVRAIPHLTPMQMFTRLEELGYRGQEEARRAACMAAYRHIQRVRAHHLDHIPFRDLPPKHNVMLIGPTGSGKTHLIELLFREVLSLPVTVVDITGFTESGYIGKSISSIPRMLLEAAGDCERKASVGIICLDEFDKIAAANVTRAMDGDGSNKDVGGYGVQRELLKMIEGQICDFRDASPWSVPTLNTHLVPFVASGTFSSFQHVLRGVARGQNPIGFSDGGPAKAPQEIEVLQSCGFMPELLGRFSRVTMLSPLSPEELAAILETRVLQNYRDECAREGVELVIEPDVIPQLVAEAQRSGHGARGLHQSLSLQLEAACFDAFSTSGGGYIRLRMQGSCMIAETCSAPASIAFAVNG